MRKLFFILTIFSIPTYFLGQGKSIYIPDRITNNKNWDYNQFEYQKSVNFGIKLLSSDTSFDGFYRISTSCQMIEVWKIDTVYGGQVINFTRTSVDDDEREKIKSELIYNKVSLLADTAQMIFSKFKNLDSIPDMSKIKGWGIGFDGVTYSIERSSKKEYHVKSYWTPTAQADSIMYKSEIISFIEYIYKDLNLYRHYEEFTSNLPYGSYTDGFTNLLIHRNKQKIRRKLIVFGG